MEDPTSIMSRSSSRCDIASNPVDTGSAPQLKRIPELRQPGSSDHTVPSPQLPALQVVNGEPEGLEPIVVDDADPANFDLVAPNDQNGTTISKHKLELRSELLFSARHLQYIFDDAGSLHLFSSFLHKHRPESVPLLTYYLEALKALRAIEYSNAVLRSLEPLAGYDFTNRLLQSQPTANTELQAKARTAFDLLARDDLPMYITRTWIRTVSSCIKHRIIGTPSRHEYEGLAEVFCLTDPWRDDNPIVFMSEEFNRTTQYGVNYVIGRNCRFLQGPCTNQFSIHRIRKKLEAGEEHYETFLNYRRDGSPFMNLVMLAPLFDSRGRIRYFLGAQVDVSGLAMSSYGLDAMKRLVDEVSDDALETAPGIRSRDEFTELAQILSPRELEIVRNFGGDMHRFMPSPNEQRGDRLGNTSDPEPERAHNHVSNNTRHGSSKNRVLIQDPESPNHESASPAGSFDEAPATSLVKQNGRLSGVYENYLLVRPYPSLRILFTSPSMRVPGILQSRLLDRIGGSASMREKLEKALSEGRGVTAKVKWNSTIRHGLTNATPVIDRFDNYQHNGNVSIGVGDTYDAAPASKGRSRWIHCTPLVGANGAVGVWMVVIVDAEADSRKGKRPPISQRTTSVRQQAATGPIDASRVADNLDSLQEARVASEARPRKEGDVHHSNSNSLSNTYQLAPVNLEQHRSFNTSQSPVTSLKNGSSPSMSYKFDATARADKHSDETNLGHLTTLGIRQPGRSNKNTVIAPWWSPPGDPSEWKAQQDLSKEILSAITEGPSDLASYASDFSGNGELHRPQSPGSLFDVGIDTKK